MIDSNAPLLLGALLLGFFGSVHCLAMCGGIAGALGQAVPGQTASSAWLRSLIYSIGRIASYCVAGAIVGVLGEAFAAQTGLVVALRFAAGLLIALFGLHVAGWWSGMTSLERAGLVLWRRVAALTRRVGRPDRPWKMLLLGMLWGWLPCGLVYSALAGAAASARADIGIAFMLCFGIGTLPALVPAGALSAQLANVLAARSSRRIAGVVMLCFGIWSVAGAAMPLMSKSSHSMEHAVHATHE